MGTSYTAILAVGKEFEDRHEAEDFLRDNNFLTDVTGEDIDDSGLAEFLPEGLEGSPLNYYSGYGFYIGFEISCRGVESFRKDFEEGTSVWEALFPNDEAEIIHTVRVS